MGILQRFGDIISANINALLDKAEDPSKMIDQYLRNMTEDFSEVKKETAGIMAEEARAKRLLDENEAESARFAGLAEKALLAGNEDDARVFLKKKQELLDIGAGLKASYAAAKGNSAKMREMHDKLASDINTLNARRQAIKTKVAVAKTQQRVNSAAASSGDAGSAMGAFQRMEEKADRMLDSANAMAELDAAPADAASALEEKYSGADADKSVEDELAAMKARLGL